MRALAASAARRISRANSTPGTPAALLIFTGIRPCEMCGLRVNAIDFRRNVVEIDRTLTPVGWFDGNAYEPVEPPPPPPKTDAGDRNIPIPAWLTEALSQCSPSATSGRSDLSSQGSPPRCRSRWPHPRSSARRTNSATTVPQMLTELRRTQARRSLQAHAVSTPFRKYQVIRYAEGESDDSVEQRSDCRDVSSTVVGTFRYCRARLRNSPLGSALRPLNPTDRRRRCERGNLDRSLAAAPAVPKITPGSDAQHDPGRSC